MKDLLVAVPSRGRPHNIDRLIGSMRDTCLGDTTLLVGLDDDDPDLGKYLNLRGIAKGDTPISVEVVIKRGLRQVVAWINELTVPRAADYRFTGHIGDDNVPVTTGWDVHVMDALEKTPFAFCNDLNPHRPSGSLACHVFCRSEVVAALGYLGPPELQHMYVDNVWTTWGAETGITYLHETLLPHRHFTTGQAAYDENYAQSGLWMGPDAVAYAMYCTDPEGLRADIRKIRAVL